LEEEQIVSRRAVIQQYGKHRHLNSVEREAVLACLHGEVSELRARAIYAAARRGKYHCSIRTMYRISPGGEARSAATSSSSGLHRSPNYWPLA